MRGPLEGVRVLDFTQYIAGPAATRQMAEMGAEVIKVELAPAGDLARALPLIRDGRSAYFVQQNLGKKSLCVDIRKPEAVALLKELVAKVDVLVENYSPGVIGRIGLGWEVVHAINPQLIMCSVSAFGQTGPLANQPGFDFVAQAYTGVTSMIGEPDASPPLTGAAVGDVGGGMSALAAINAALYWRRGPGGGGQYLDIALIDFYFYTHGLAVQMHSASGGKISLTRTGRYHTQVAPAGVFASKQGFIIIVPVGDDMWQRLARAMGREDLLADPRYASNATRLEHRDTLTAVVEGWLAAQASDAEAMAQLREARVPYAPVLSVADAMREPHLVARGTVRTLDDPVLGRLQVPGNPLRFSGFPADNGLMAADLGQHNDEIVTGLLGRSAVELRRLQKQGVLVAKRSGR
ncbi:MAG: CoA transferase [Alphaproteobacteria bacterium]|nr:CoA transferase [Alphaproteobacteria bacterium]